MPKTLLTGLVVVAISISLIGPCYGHDAYLHIDGIQGESMDSEHQDWIDVISFKWGHALPAVNITGSRRSGRAHFEDLSIEKYIDKASSKLALSGVNGRVFPEIELEIGKSIAGQTVVFLEIKLRSAMVTSYMVKSNAGGQAEERLLERVSFNFGRIEWVYTQIDQTGRPVGKFQSSWDLNTNQGG